MTVADNEATSMAPAAKVTGIRVSAFTCMYMCPCEYVAHVCLFLCVCVVYVCLCVCIVCVRLNMCEHLCVYPLHVYVCTYIGCTLCLCLCVCMHGCMMLWLCVCRLSLCGWPRSELHSVSAWSGCEEITTLWLLKQHWKYCSQ